jgi:hypothetical protein
MGRQALSPAESRGCAFCGKIYFIVNMKLLEEMPKFEIS